MAPEANLPSLYNPWLHAITSGPIPAETKATCDNCAMLPSRGSHPDASYFHPVTKCCAYQPHLPNFLAGRILSDSDTSMAAGRSELERRIANKIGVSPRWAGPGNLFGLLYKNVPNVFGRAPALRCQFLSPTGGCGIWNHRPAVCATWYCKYVRGETGFRFWKLTDKLFQTIEHDLSLWCLAELKVDFSEIDEIALRSAPDVSELGGDLDVAQYRRQWGSWIDREAEFYRTCGDLVDHLSWDQVQELCGPRVRILVEMVRDAYAHLESDAIPERLWLGRLNFANIEDGGYRIISYSQYDPLLMPLRLARVLHYFDGRATADALEAILTNEGIRIDLGLVRRMVDFGVLKSPGAEDKTLSVLR